MERPTRRAVPLLAGLLFLVPASCGRLTEPKKSEPSPSPPSEKVPNAPGPDNSIKELPANTPPAPPTKGP